jgi:hypothetical protein
MLVVSSSEWKEAKPCKRESGPIYKFRRGYSLGDTGRHETADQYVCFQKYLMLQGSRSTGALCELTGHSFKTISDWSNAFNWQNRAAAYDKDQMAIVWKEVEKYNRNTHKDAIIEFRESSERQARMMAKVAEDLLRVLGKRVMKAEEEGEEVPMTLVSGLLRATASISEQSRQSWANALGVNEMLEMVETEMNRAEVADVTDVDAYEIPVEE